MKRIVVLGVLLLAVILFLASCSSTTVVHSKSKTGKVPPGQMKKATGSQSAKEYAPGQQKKQTTKPASKSTPAKSTSGKK